MNEFVPTVPGFHPRQIHVRSPEDWVWITTEAQEWVDGRGRRWIVPTGFASDLCSVPRPFWAWRPPSVGMSDLHSLFHDFLRRCRNALGLSVREIDLEMFPALIQDTGHSWKRAFVKSVAVYAAARMNIGLGHGNCWYGANEEESVYDHNVHDSDGKEIPLVYWVDRHYRPDGKGWNG